MTKPNFGMSRNDPIAAAAPDHREDAPARAGGERGAGDVEERVRIRRRRRHHHVLLAAEPEDHRRDEHERAGNAEGDARAVAAQENRHEERGEERAEIDDPVEGIEHHLRAMLVRLVELVADERRDARLDAARAERNQREAGVEAGAVIFENREARVPGAVDEAEPEDRVVFAEEPIGQPAAEQREKVNADDEGVEDILRRAGAIAFRQIREQRRDEEHRQDVPHPVEAEALATFVADDVADLAGDRRVRVRAAGSAAASLIGTSFIAASVGRTGAPRNRKDER